MLYIVYVIIWTKLNDQYDFRSWEHIKVILIKRFPCNFHLFPIRSLLTLLYFKVTRSELKPPSQRQSLTNFG